MFIIDQLNNVNLTRGDTAKFEISLEDGSGSAYDFSDDELKFGLKRSALDKDCIIEKDIDPETGKFELTPEDTEDLEFGDYIYSVEVRHTVEAESAEEEDTVEIYSPIVARFSLTFNVL